MGIMHMQGTPAHLEYLKIKGEARRKKCMYLKDKICHCKRSPFNLLRCNSRRHCEEYKPLEKRDGDNFKGTCKINEIKLTKLVGLRYRLQNLETNKKIVVEFVEEYDVDIDKNKLSINSPLALAVNGKFCGSNIKVREENKEVEYKILKFIRIK